MLVSHLRTYTSSHIMSKKSCPFWYGGAVCSNEQDFLDVQFTCWEEAASKKFHSDLTRATDYARQIQL